MTQTLFRLQGVSKAFADTTVLEAVDFQVGVFDRVGIIGPNGAGKSTLLNVIAQRIVPDSGTVQWMSTECTFHYLTQVREETAQNEREQDDFYLVSKRIGLLGDVADAPMTTLSGGERTKLAIAGAWSSHADLLILDEPTNHLDSHGMAWLTEQIRRYVGAVIVVSHDRYFLDQTVTQILELHDGHARLYVGNYSAYARERDREREAQRHRYEAEQKQQASIETKIAQLKTWANKSHREAGKQGTPSERRQMGLKQFQRAKAKKLDQRVQSQIRRLEKLRVESVEKPSEIDPVHFDVTDATRHGRSILEARGLGKRFGERVLFRESDFYVLRGERIGLVGYNGCGKTTLIKMILGEIAPSEGQLWVSPTAQPAYLAQDEGGALVDTTIAALERQLSPDARAQFRTNLANMGFRDAHLTTPIARFSLGERTRLRIAWMVQSDHNLLILDEPTNHLDIQSREELERALESYRGTLLVVTHDLYFLDRVCDKRLVFTEGRIRKVDGGTAQTSPPPIESIRDREEALMVLNTQITRLLGDLSTVKPTEPQYASLDTELNTLLSRRKSLLASVREPSATRRRR